MAGRGSEQLQEFLDESKIRIGFAHDKQALDSDLEGIKDIVRREQPEARERQVGLRAGQLNRFINELQQGDRVLVYEFGTRLYHVGEVCSSPKFEERSVLPYTRKVKWVGVVSRDDLSASSKNALGSVLTLFSVNEETQKEIELALSGKTAHTASEDEVTEEISEEGEEVATKAKEFMKDKIQQLSWDEMQELVAGLLRAMGYRTKVSPSGPDRGKDIVASPDGLGLEDPRIHVEVKHRKGQMGAQEIRSFSGGLRKAKGLYVSTGGFSREAHYEAERSEVPITLIDVDELARMITKYYDSFDTEARDLLPLKKIYWPL